MTALDYRPGNLGGTATGIVVEGVGSGACAFTLASIKAATVHYIRKHKPTWTELSPQRGCATLARYKQMIHGIITYVRARVPGLAATWWAGFMLDEEPNFGFTAAQAISLNKYAVAQTNALPGVTFVFTENATWSGGWTQSQYNRIVGATEAAPQVYNSLMVKIVNNSAPDHQPGDVDEDHACPVQHQGRRIRQDQGQAVQQPVRDRKDPELVQPVAVPVNSFHPPASGSEYVGSREEDEKVQ